MAGNGRILSVHEYCVVILKIRHWAKNKNTFENAKTLSWAIPHTDLRMKRYRG